MFDSLCFLRCCDCFLVSFFGKPLISSWLPGTYWRKLILRIERKYKDNEIASKFDLSKYQIIETKSELQEWQSKAENIGYVSFDTETNSLDAMNADMIGFSLCTSENDACYVPLLHTNEGGRQLKFDQAIEILRQILEDEGIKKILHNMKYDALVIDKYNIKIKNFDDTILMSYSLGSGGVRHKLDTLIKYYFNHDAISFKELIGSGKDKKTFQELIEKQQLLLFQQRKFMQLQN